MSTKKSLNSTEAGAEADVASVGTISTTTTGVRFIFLNGTKEFATHSYISCPVLSACTPKCARRSHTTRSHSSIVVGAMPVCSFSSDREKKNTNVVKTERECMLAKTSMLMGICKFDFSTLSSVLGFRSPEDRCYAARAEWVFAAAAAS